MATYIGDKSLDAEVSIDLIEGKVTMDYSLNKFFSEFSNYSYSTEEKITLMKQIEIFFKILWSIYYSSIYFIVGISHIIVLKIMRKDTQYWVQKHQKNLVVISSGVKIYEKEGKSSDVVTYHLEKNLWLEYELFGEYKEKIKSISLKRNVITVVWRGITRKKQEGWIVEFKFTSAPKEGKLILKYV